MHTNVSPTAEPGTAERVDTGPRDWFARFAPVNAEEAALIGHTRGWCHNSTVCALCAALTEQANARVMAERQYARARTQELRAVDAEIQNAYLSRELMRATNTLDSIISG